MIDLDALDASITEGEKKNFFVAPIVKELIAELREARGERAAVVAWLRECAYGHDGLGSRNTGNLLRTLSTNIERGEHRRKVAP